MVETQILSDMTVSADHQPVLTIRSLLHGVVHIIGSDRTPIFTVYPSGWAAVDIMSRLATCPVYWGVPCR